MKSKHKTWACAKGHFETAIILYKWNHNSINIKNRLQQAPMDVARVKGFINITAELERLEIERNGKKSQTSLASTSSFTTSSSTSDKINPSDSILFEKVNISASSSSSSSSTSNSKLNSETIKNRNNNSYETNNSSESNSHNHNSNQMKSNSNNNSLNGNFNQNQQKILSNENNEQNTSATYNENQLKESNQTVNNNELKNNRNSLLLESIKNPSLTSILLLNNSNSSTNSTLTISTTSSSASNDYLLNNEIFNTTNGNYNGTTHITNRSNNNNLSNEIFITQSQCVSPTTSTGSIGSNRSHDGVFLRPGAVSSSGQSPPGARLTKRSSVDSGINMDIRSTLTRSGKLYRDQQKYQSSFDANESNFTHSLDSNSDLNISGSSSSLLSPLRKMDFALCEVSAGNSSPLQDKRSGSDDDDDDDDITDTNNTNDRAGVAVVGDSDAKVLTLAEHIIAAMPERIKNESEEIMPLGSPMSESLNTDTAGMGSLNDSFMEPLLDSLPNPQFDHEFNFEFSDHSYRYRDVGTPCSSLSPASSGPLQSPASYSVPPDPPMSSPSPPPSAKELTEFLQASSISQRPFEADFSNLTLTDREQRELYEAAKCIQKAYRSYKGRKKLEEQDKERSAAIVIQNYYRRYKQFAYYRQMTHAALVIQNGYRSYCENKRFKKSQNQNINTNDSQDSQCLKNYYNSYQNDQQQQLQCVGSTIKEPSPSGPLKRTYSQRTQNQAARTIQQFMRQSKMKLQRERVEKERLAHQRRAEYLQNLQQHHGQQEVALCRELNEIQRNVVQQSHHSVPHLNINVIGSSNTIRSAMVKNYWRP